MKRKYSAATVTWVRHLAKTLFYAARFSMQQWSKCQFYIHQFSSVYLREILMICF